MGTSNHCIKVKVLFIAFEVTVCSDFPCFRVASLTNTHVPSRPSTCYRQHQLLGLYSCTFERALLRVWKNFLPVCFSLWDSDFHFLWKTFTASSDYFLSLISGLSLCLWICYCFCPLISRWGRLGRYLPNTDLFWLASDFLETSQFLMQFILGASHFWIHRTQLQRVSLFSFPFKRQVLR